MVTDIAGTILEQFDYLPYGEKCNNSGLAVANTDKTDYLYGGKELPQLFGIDWYDSAARWQTTSGIFVSPDPLMEKYYSISPYAYCVGNPVNLVDPDGKIWETALDIGSLVMGVKSFTTNVKEGNVGGAIVDGLGIVADAIAVATPFVPGVASAGIAAARGIDKGADALKAVDKTTEVAQLARKTDNVKTYQTYTKTNAKTGEIYVGRTSGTGSPQQNVKNRDRNHHVNKKGFGPAKIDKTSTNKEAIRGQEQYMINLSGGAKSDGGYSGNSINGVRNKNPKRLLYEDARKKEFGD